MRYFAKDLPSVYKILETLPKPLAVLDFMCGTVGHEFAASQSIGGVFYDKWHQGAHVVALCWEGACILYSNVSDDQIEFTNKKQSRFGDKEAKGWKRKRWLIRQGHTDSIEFTNKARSRLEDGWGMGLERFRWSKKQGCTDGIAAIPGIVVRWGPYDVSGKAMKRYHELDNVSQWEMIRERLTRTGYIFSTEEPPLIQEPYIAIFDRNERIGPDRNTHTWQVELFRQWAKEFGFKLAVISDFYPRRWESVISVPFADRNLDRLCNVIYHSVLYAAPASGSGAAGWVFGCNFVALGVWNSPHWPMLTKNVLRGVVEGRGFQHFGFLDSRDGEVANRIRKYLAVK
jgi:hypothetical protein